MRFIIYFVTCHTNFPWGPVVQTRGQVNLMIFIFQTHTVKTAVDLGRVMSYYGNQ